MVSGQIEEIRRTATNNPTHVQALPKKTTQMLNFWYVFPLVCESKRE
jgi:uncharacterized membrane protein